MLNKERGSEWKQFREILCLGQCSATILQMIFAFVLREGKKTAFVPSLVSIRAVSYRERYTDHAADLGRKGRQTVLQ